MKFINFFSNFVSKFCPPGSGSELWIRIRMRIQGHHWIRIQFGSGSTALQLLKHALKRSGLKNFASCWKGEAISSNVFETVLFQCTGSRTFWNGFWAPCHSLKVSCIYMTNLNRHLNGNFFVWKRRVPGILRKLTIKSGADPYLHGSTSNWTMFLVSKPWK